VDGNTKIHVMNEKSESCERHIHNVRVVPDLIFPNPAEAGFCRILMANPPEPDFSP